MVDLDCMESAKPPPANDGDNENLVEPMSSSNVEERKQLCRLCLLDEHTSEKVVNIFDEFQIDEQGNKTKGLEDILYDLFQIKYDRSCSFLPHVICQRCWEMVKAFDNFRKIVKHSEELLQKRLELMKSNAFLEDFDDKRPGLNGNPGVFVPDDDCEIQEINPDEEFESSDDDFSMESDSDTEEINLPAKEIDVFTPKPTQAPAVKNTTVSKPPTVTEPIQTKDVSSVLSEHKGLEFTITNTYLCQYCDMAFTTQSESLEHEASHDKVMPYICNFCPKAYNNRQAMIMHIKELHDPEKPYICALCRKGFCRRSDLKKHTIVHTGVRPFACPLCSKSFSRNTNLHKHMRIHSSIKPYVCQQCPRSFSTGTELLKHARTHSEIKSFKCSKCPAAYARKDKLQIHEQSHQRKELEALQNQNRIAGSFPMMQNQETLEMTQPINPYLNQELNSVEQQHLMMQNVNFAQRPVFPQLPVTIPSVMNTPQPPAPKPQATKSHPRIHPCDICGKSFTRERDLHRHQALHLDTLFTCKQCGLGFSRREKLARHELEQHGPQYPCDICRITFHKKDELDMHLKMHELQQNAAISAQQAILNAAGVVHGPTMEISQMHHVVSQRPIAPSSAAAAVPPMAPVVSLPPPQRPSAADMSFYSQMVPTMNLGFYSETRPEDRNGI
ncbi:zinc finger protein 436 [Musca vetustissima]|uniref:zinc finger protein 436 n=1 Tax=Musca vetustissima TaxID=27455 RepID=UPI002AB7076B|nr:zinc finger protein 436 [Musca vetustissima]